ncbi:MAG: YhcB family protein [Pseudomonadales bacterium]
MEQNVLLALIALGGLFLGLLIGILVGKKTGAGYKRGQQLEGRLASTEAELEAYKQSVQSHFSETAEAFQSLNSSYAFLQQKLAGGAQALCGEASGPLLHAPSVVPEESTSEVSELQTELPLEPPRDYAPKKSPDEKGMLTEEFGLEKPANDAA